MWLKDHINLKQKLDKLEFMTGHKHNKPSYITKHLTRYKNKKNLESSERPASFHKHEGSKATQEVCLLKNPFQEKPIGKNLGVGKKSTTLTWHSLRENNKLLESSIYPAVGKTEGLTS
jgi:hypothetical protein